VPQAPDDPDFELSVLRDWLDAWRAAVARREAVAADDEWSWPEPEPKPEDDPWPPLSERMPPCDPVWLTPNLADIPEMEPLARAMGLRPTPVTAQK
jgi:hypothetical protein